MTAGLTNSVRCVVSPVVPRRSAPSRVTASAATTFTTRGAPRKASPLRQHLPWAGGKVAAQPRPWRTLALFHQSYHSQPTMLRVRLWGGARALSADFDGLRIGLQLRAELLRPGLHAALPRCDRGWLVRGRRRKGRDPGPLRPRVVSRSPAESPLASRCVRALAGLRICHTLSPAAVTCQVL